ncbi:hypothetical protein CkaCkLH20_12465 [Colletotrichum karsti]|uniref:Extracellular mutant protein 11 C-terminal domain-containing protein n=1 Tax=Colletotrichum karsti TaxID=1095194 RepID=A0A9P6LEH9_9PEZI|nr:uncharacterized protein CkaCkLH20_12465 [Colletotrichum karsti]KAF9870106.1 hypothetical protein CkaCkLH20_12465 [Colletotrichum karsti]
MPSNTSSNRMAQYAMHSSLDAGIRTGDTNQARDRLDEQRPATPPYGFPTRQAVTESAKLPAPKPFAPGRDHFNNIRHLGQPNPPHPLRMQSPASVRDATPQRQRLRRTNSQGTDVTSFWPESHIDSQFGSPTTQRSERYDAAVDGRSRSPPAAFNFPSMQPLPMGGNMGNGERVSYTIGKNGAMRASGPGDEPGLPISSHTFPPSLEPATQADGYSSEPFNSPPKRRVNLALHSTAVKNQYAQPLYSDDQEVFSDHPTFQMPNDTLRGPKKQATFQEPRRTTAFQEDADVEGSLASDYQISEDDKGTPRASRKKALNREPAVPETSVPPPARKQRDKTRKRRRDSCDYADDELAEMTYTQLREQPFDDDPAQKSMKTIAPLTGDSLPAKLEHFKGQREAEQKQFFMQMTVNDWERSGDWLLEQFGQVAQKLKDARQNKRTMVEQFENEIAKREEAVRLRTESIDKKLSQIKHKGEDMLADKEF